MTRISRYGVLQYLPLGNFVLKCDSTYIIMKIWAINNPITMQNLTQHAKINPECNKFMEPLKLILKYETNIKTTFKIMNAHAKLKMTLNMKFDHLGQELLFSP